MAVRDRNVYRGLDGSRFALDGALALDGPTTSTADLVTGSGLRQLHAGAPGLGADMAAAAGLDGFAEEFDYRGATLRVGRTRLVDPRDPRRVDDVLLGAWEGDRYSLVAHLYNSSTTGLLELLGTLRLTEHDDGISAIPVDRAGTSFRGPATVLKPVPGLGLLEIRALTRGLAAELPSWQGVDLGVGELFRDTLSTGGTYFLLVTRQVRVTVLPLEGAPVASIPEALRGLRIERVG